MIVGQGRSEECGAAFFGAFRKAPHDQEALPIRALRYQLRAGLVPERADAAVIAPAVIKRIKRISLQPSLRRTSRPSEAVRASSSGSNMPCIFGESRSSAANVVPIGFRIKIRRHAVAQCVLVVGHERAAPHFLQAADGLLFRQLHHCGPRGIIDFGVGRPEGKTVRCDRFDLFVLRVEGFRVFETSSAAPPVCPFPRIRDNGRLRAPCLRSWQRDPPTCRAVCLHGYIRLRRCSGRAFHRA